LAERLADTTVALVGRDDDGDVFPLCAGVWVSRFEFVTAAHCVTTFARAVLGLAEDAPVGVDGIEMPYIGPGQYRGIYVEPTRVYTATLRKIDIPHDIAILSSNEVPQHLDAVIAPASPRTGEPVIVVGHPTAMYWTQSVGYVAGHFDRIMQKDGPLLEIDAVVYKGNSGGGVFDYQGQLVGIASFISPTPGIGIFVDVETVRRFSR
jgi:S1-C subfamily serine protease